MPSAVDSSATVPAVANRLALVVPMKDEAAGLPALGEALAALRQELVDLVALEFVFVDDGSLDDTWPLLHDRFGAWPGVQFVRHRTNQGIAASIATGLQATDAEWAASIDADLSYDPRELRTMLALREGADLVTASPYHPSGGVAGVPRWRLALSRTLSFAYRSLLRAPIHTWTSCFRLYRRAVVVDLPLANPGFLGTAELLVRVLRRGGRVREHPCVLGVRRFGQSKMKIARTIFGHLRLLAAVALRRVK